MNVKLLYDRVLIERVETLTKTSGGIIIPGQAQEKPAEGKVIAIGEGLPDSKGNKIPLDVKKGEKVLFAKFAGMEVDIEGKEYLIIKESDILAILD